MINGHHLTKSPKDRGVDKEWVLAFFKGDKPEIRLELLKTIAKELEAPEAMFVGRAVTHLLSDN